MSTNILQKIYTIRISFAAVTRTTFLLLLLLPMALFIRTKTNPSLATQTPAINTLVIATDDASASGSTTPALPGDTVTHNILDLATDTASTKQTPTDNPEVNDAQIDFALPETNATSQNTINVSLTPTAPQAYIPSASTPAPTEPFLIDTIVAVVMNDEGTEIVTLSYTKRPSLSGTQRTLEDIVFELLVFLDATKHKITPDNDAVDKYLETIQKDNNLTREQLEEIFAQSGYTFEEALKEFKKMQANNIMLEYKIKSNLVVPRKKIEKYFEENPETLEASYELEYALVPFDPTMPKKDQFKMLIDTISNTPDTDHIKWGSPFWVTKGELAEEKYFLIDLPVCGISTPEQIENGFELYRLRNKNNERLKSIEERYTEIANILRRPRYAKLIDEYKEQLFATSSVQYF